MTMQPSAVLTRRKLLLYLALAVCAVLAVWVASHVPDADWSGTFDAAGRGIFQGRSPYDQPVFRNPPWAVLILLPFVIFPFSVARGLVLVVSVVSLIYIGWRLRAPKLALIAMLLSPTAVGAMLAANLDAFVIPGIFLPAAWGLLVLMIKPQVGTGLAVYYLVESWRDRKWLGVLRTFAPLAIAAALGALLFPVWIGRMTSAPDNIWNRSIFPFGIPIGLALLWLAIQRRNKFFALAAGPFLSPYLTFYTYLVVQIGLLDPEVDKFVRRDVLQIILCIFLWVIMLRFRL